MAYQSVFLTAIGLDLYLGFNCLENKGVFHNPSKNDELFAEGSLQQPRFLLLGLRSLRCVGHEKEGSLEIVWQEKQRPVRQGALKEIHVATI